VEGQKKDGVKFRNTDLHKHAPHLYPILWFFIIIIIIIIIIVIVVVIIIIE
jgi:heme/copper-type cytochrome/quinol oxidase subunit 2